MSDLISVSAPGKSLLGSVGTDITFNTRYPFHKLDSTNPVSFQVISLFFNTEPPDPNASPGNSATLKTLVYSYPHGYTYTPSTWFLISTDNFTSVKGTEGAWIIGNPSGVNSQIAKLEVEVDDKNVNFYIDKYWQNVFSIPPPHVIGYTVSIRAYIFVEDLTATMVPSHS